MSPEGVETLAQLVEAGVAQRGGAGGAQQPQARGLLEFFEQGHGLRGTLMPHDGAQALEHHGVQWAFGAGDEACDLIGHGGIAGRPVGNVGHVAHLHHLVGRDGWQDVLRGPYALQAQRHQVRAVGVQHATRVRGAVVDAAVQGQGLAGALSGKLLAIGGHPGQGGGVELAEAGVGGGNEEATALRVVQAQADVAGRGVRVATQEQRGAHAHDLLAAGLLGGGHAGLHAATSVMARASRKKSGPPKLPDLSASSSSSPPCAVRAPVQGTPGQMLGPMRS